MKGEYQLEINRNKKPSIFNTGFAGINLHVVIGLILMFGIGRLPAPEPMTQIGLALLGIFVGVVYLWATCDLGWPSLLAIAAISFYMHGLYEIPPGNHGIWKAVELSLGNWVVMYLFVVLLLLHALNASGFTNRLALWFLTQKFAQKSAWGFTFAFFHIVMLFALFIDVAAAQIFFFTLAYTIFQKLGYKKGDTYPLMMMIGITFICCLGFAMTPIGHALTIIGLGVYEGISGTPISYLQYMLVGIPTGLLAYAALLLFFRYGVKPDMSKFQNVNYGELMGERPGPMQLREKLIVFVFAIVVFFWILPGFVSMVAPGSALVAFLDEITGLIPAMAGVIALILIEVENKPLLNYHEGFKQMPWGVILLVSAAMLFGTVLTLDATGVSAFITAKLTPILQQEISPYALLAILLSVIILTTNILNHVPVIIMFAALSIPLAQTLGMNSQALATLSILSAQWGFALPAALAPIAFLYGNEFVVPSKVMKYGVFMIIVTFIATLAFAYPLSLLVFA